MNTVISDERKAAGRVYAAVSELNAALSALPAGCTAEFSQHCIGTMARPDMTMFTVKMLQELPEEAA